MMLIQFMAFTTTMVYSFWRIFFSLPFGYRTIDMIFAVLLLVSELLGFLEAGNYLNKITHVVEPKCPDINKEEYPHVDVFIATYNEHPRLLEKTINGCLNMDYPNKGKVHIYLCDDNDREDICKLAEKMEIGYFRRDNHKGAKAGNFNHAMQYTNSPLIVTLDADMIPMHDFLMAMVPLFFLDKHKKEIGFVQSPQSFYNTDLFQYNLYSEGDVPGEQSFFFSTVQITRNQNNSVIYAGSNTILSRKALEEIGGFYEKAITEDLATGMLIQAKGYQSYSIREVHASGLAPTDLKSLFKQRDRWARGCIQTYRRLHMLTLKGLNFHQKMDYLSSILYWYACIRRLLFIAAPILFVTCGIVFLNCKMWEILMFWVPHYIFYSWALSVLSHKTRSSRLSNIYDTILFPYLMVGVLLETVGIQKKEFSVTRKDKREDSTMEKLSLCAVHLILLFLNTFSIGVALYQTVMEGTGMHVIILFWLLFNFYNLLMAILFIMGRKNERLTQRLAICAAVELHTPIRTYFAKTTNLSEGGAAVYFDFPEYFSEDKIQLMIREGRYEVHMEAEIAKIVKKESGWEYSLRFLKIEEKERLQLYQILYDRVPPLPSTISVRSGFYEDLQENIKQRLRGKSVATCRLPRIEVHKKLMLKNGGEIRLLDFNYEYGFVRGTKQELTKQISICVDSEKELIIMGVKKEEPVDWENFKYQNCLYEIMNGRELSENSRFRSCLREWMLERECSLEEDRKKNKKGEEWYDEMAELETLAELESLAEREALADRG